MFAQFGINAGYVEDLHAKWQQSPQSVDEKWRLFFSDFEAGKPVSVPPPPPAVARTNGNGAAKHVNGATISTLRLELPHDTFPPPSVVAGAEAAGRVYQLVNAYRVRGHLFANLTRSSRRDGPGARPRTSACSQADLDLTFPTVDMAGLPERATLREIIAHLAETYCRSIGVEFTHIEEPEARDWLQNAMESTQQPRSRSTATSSSAS